MASDGKVTIETKLESDGLQKDAQKMERDLIAQMQQLVDKIDKLFTSIQPEVDVKAEADTKQAESDIKGIEGATDGVRPEVDLDADTQPAETKVDTFEQETDAIKVETTVDADTTPAKKSVDDLDKRFDKLKDDLGKLGKAAAVAFAAVGAAALAAGKQAVQIGMDFEASMSEVKAISGATADEMAALTQKAKEMGASTKFSAKESATALKYMGMAGWDAQQMIDGLPGIMNLAAASGEELGTVSDIVTDALTAMGLKASDAGHFADVLAKAATSSNTNVGMMGETFKYAAPLAGALGFSVEDLSVAIGLMANSGIKGGEAGTALRAILSRLAKPTAESQRAMDKLDLSLTNADGTMRPLNEIIVDMRDGFDKLSEAEKANVAAALGGQEAMSGLLAIVNASDDDFNALTESINNSTGAAEEMARIMQDNLAGDMEELGGALETLGIKFFEAFNEPMREAAQAAAEAVDQISEAFDSPEMQTALSTIADGLSGLIQSFADFAADAIPKLVEGIAWVVENFDSIATVLEIAGTAFVAFKAAAAIETVVGKATDAITKAGGAMKMLSGFLMANPWAVAAAGIAVLVAAGGKLNEALHSASDEAIAFSKESQALRDEIAKTGKEASESSDNYFNHGQAMRENALNAHELVEELLSLQKETELNADQQKRQKEIVNELNDIYPALGLLIDEQTGALSRSREELATLIELEKSREQLNAKDEHRAELYATQERQISEQARALEELREAEAKLAQAERDLEEASFFAKGNAQADVDTCRREVSNFSAEYDILGEKISLTGTQIKGVEEDIASLNGEIDKNLGILDEYAERNAAAAKAIGDEYAPLIDETQRVIDKTNELNETLSGNAQSFADSQSAIEAEKDVVKRLADDMHAAGEGTAEFDASVSSLATRFGEFSETLESQGGIANMTAEQITAYGEALAAASEIDLIDERSVELMNDYYTAQRGLEESASQLATVRREQAAIDERIAAALALENQGAGDLTGTLSGLYEQQATLNTQESELEEKIAILSQAYDILSGEVSANADQRAAAQAIIDEAARNGMVVTQEELEAYKQAKEDEAKAAEEAAQRRTEAINKVISDAQSAYEGYLAKAQNLTSAINTESELTMAGSEEILNSNTETMNKWSENMDALAEKARQGIISEALLEDIRKMGPEALNLTSEMVNSADEKLTSYSEAHGRAGEAAKNALSEELEAALGVSDAMAQAIANSLVTALESGDEVDEAAKTWIGNALDAANTEAGNNTTVTEIGSTIDSAAAPSLSSGTKTPDAGKTLIGSTETAMSTEVTAQDFATNVGDKMDVDTATGITKGTATEEAAKTAIEETKTAAGTAVTEADFESTGKTMVDNMATGITGNQSTLSTAARTAANAGKLAADGIMNDTTGFQIGSNFGQGMADGIASKQESVVAAAQAIAQAAADASKAQLDEHSPSRVARQIGAFFSLGLAGGVEDETNAVINAVQSLTDEMVDNLVTEVDFLAAVDYDQLQGMAMGASMADQARLAAIASSGSVANTYNNDSSSQGDTITIEEIHIHADNLDDPDSVAEAFREIGRDIALQKRYKGVT